MNAKHERDMTPSNTIQKTMSATGMTMQKLRIAKGNSTEINLLMRSSNFLQHTRKVTNARRTESNNAEAAKTQIATQWHARQSL